MAADLEVLWDELVEDLRHATFDARTAEQLLRVGATCVLRVQGHEHLECTLRFESKPAEVEAGGDPGAEIVVEIPAEHVARFWERPLPMAIMRDGATYEGPVRRLLSVYPILRVKAQERRRPASTDAEVGAR